MTLSLWNISTPLGDMMAVEEHQKLIMLDFIQKPDAHVNVLAILNHKDVRQEKTSLFKKLENDLALYFEGHLFIFDLPLNPHGTPFQKRAWDILCDIPYGETRSYGEQAMMVGSSKAARAVGSANGKNPISIIIPCHRVVGAKGSLGGYNSGLDRKKWLLALEKSHLPHFVTK